jgi:hypothetical protein
VFAWRREIPERLERPSGGAARTDDRGRDVACTDAGPDSPATSSRDHADWQELLGPAESDLFGRARSASDATVLRRKGHLKEQDQFIDFIIRMHEMLDGEEVRVLRAQRPHSLANALAAASAVPPLWSHPAVVPR